MTQSDKMQLFSEAFQFLPVLILPEGEAVSGASSNEGREIVIFFGFLSANNIRHSWALRGTRFF